MDERITSGEPNEWKVVEVWAYDRGQFQETNLSFVEYLRGLLDGSLRLQRTGLKPFRSAGSNVTYEPLTFDTTDG